MESREEIFEALKNSLIELFGISETAITMEARLKEDIDIDSIDSFDLLVRLEEKTGLNLTPDDFKDCECVGDLVDHLVVRFQEKVA